MIDKPDARQLRATYDLRFQHNDLRDSDSYYRWVFQKIRAQPNKVLLDVACGSGRLLYYAKQAGLHTLGLDFSGEGLRAERSIEPDARLVLADGQFLPLASNTIDYVTNLGSLEHFIDPEQGIREMVRVLRPEGVAALVLPNAFYLVDLIWWVWRTGHAGSHKQPIERFAAYGNWLDLLERNGLKVYKGYRYNFIFPRSKLDWAYYQRFPRKMLDVLVSPFIPFHFSFSFLYLCRKENV